MMSLRLVPRVSRGVLAATSSAAKPADLARTMSSDNKSPLSR